MVYEGVVDGVSILMMRWKRGKQVTDREKAGICGRVFGVRIGGGVHNSRWWTYIEQVYSPEVMLEGCGERMPLLGSSGSTVSDQQSGDTSINALWGEWSARIQQLGSDGQGEGRLAVQFTSLTMCQRGLGGDSTLIKRWKYCEQAGEREKAGTDGRVFDGRIGVGVHKSQYVLERNEQGFHYDYTVEIW
ncbi:hypothetical protein T02_12252 [Trichinella nativa]|uniref:Uncharacterized protein n=1 Tax=Trichinella nativa TaxID=6335 RepID=A0A0V1LK07_9BILA|nr:hypothetical protein T02_12252 [Trichinella nativa]